MTDQNETRHQANGDGVRGGVSVAGNLPNHTRALSPSQHKAMVNAIGDAIEGLIAILDALDGDPDLEDGFDREQCCDDEDNGDLEPEVGT